MADYAYIQQTTGQDKGPWVVGVAAGCIAFTVTAVALRFWSRALFKAGFWWDDYTILISLPFTLAQIGLELGWVSAGLGKHIWAPGVQPEKGYKILFALELIYSPGITLIRISVVLFYHRIFGRERYFRIALWCTGGMLIAWYIGITVVAIFQCSPVQKHWDYTLPGHCLSFYGTFIGVTAPNVFIDLWLLILPVPMLWKLQIRTTQKIALTANFLLGYSVIVVTVMRVVSITSVPDDGVADVTWNSTTPSVLFILESSFATLSICLPAISSLATHGSKKFPISSLRSTWFKRSQHLKASKRESIKTFCPTIRSPLFPSSSSSSPEMTKPSVVRHGPQSESTCPPNRDGQRARETSVFREQLSSSHIREYAPEMRSPTKSVELERRIRQFYRPPVLSVGSDNTMWQDVEIGIESPLARDLSRAPPPKDVYIAPRW